MATKEQMLKEAERRIKELGLLPCVLKDFKRGVIYYSETTPLGSILYWLDNDQKLVDMKNELEKNGDCIVYHMIHTYYRDMGETFTFLIVSKYDEEWKYELDNRNDEYGFNAFAAVKSEATFGGYDRGDVCVKERTGGLVRTY